MLQTGDHQLSPPCSKRPGKTHTAPGKRISLPTWEKEEKPSFPWREARSGVSVTASLAPHLQFPQACSPGPPGSLVPRAAAGGPAARFRGKAARHPPDTLWPPPALQGHGEAWSGTGMGIGIEPVGRLRGRGHTECLSRAKLTGAGRNHRPGTCLTPATRHAGMKCYIL